MEEHTVVLFDSDGARIEETFRGRWLVQRHDSGNYLESVAQTETGEVIVFTEEKSDYGESYLERHEDLAGFESANDHGLIERVRAALST